MRMTLLLTLFGLASIAYGTMLARRRAGTHFYATWFVLGALGLAAGWVVHAGIWSASPALVRCAIALSAASTLVVLICVCVLILRQFGAEGPRGLDYLVILGAQIYADGRPSPVLCYRLDTALAYLRDNLETRCVVSGGQGPDEPFPEAEGMARYLLERGVARERVILEHRSTNTLENVTYALELIESTDCRVGIVTNDFHLFRAIRLTRKAGMRNVWGIAASSTAWNLPNNLLRECLATVKDFIAGNL